MSEYAEFLTTKSLVHIPTGLKRVPKIHERLFPFQADLTRWALKRGRAGLFEATGLGKTIQQLEFARHVENHTKAPTILFTPLSVAEQTKEEALKHLGLETKIITEDSEVESRGIHIINYAKLHKLSLDKFSCVILDEASVLKGYDRSTASRLIDGFKETPFRLVCTATPAPNDTMELGAYAEFLGVMSMSEMLSTFFVHDAGETQKWRLKGHAENDFWKWMASWCACVSSPSDLGYENKGYDLPKLHTKEIVVNAGYVPDGEFFAKVASTLEERRDARRYTLDDRVAEAANQIKSNDEQWVAWCGLNSEQDNLAKLLGDDCVSIQGSTSDEDKIQLHAKWKRGDVRVLISKIAVFGFGLNWQHCRNMAFVGLSDSYEAVHQGVRRIWRFGQEREVNVYLIISDSEGAVLENIKRKEKDAIAMQRNLVAHMAEITKKEIQGITRTKLEYNPTQKMKLPAWI